MSRNLDHEIQQAKSRIGQLEAELREKRKLLRKLELEAIERDHSIRLGSQVIYRGSAFAVTRIHPGYAGGKPSLYGAKFKKDGEPSARDQYIGTEWSAA